MPAVSDLADGCPAIPGAQLFKRMTDDSPSPWSDSRDEGGRKPKADGAHTPHSAFRILHLKQLFSWIHFGMDDWSNWRLMFLPREGKNMAERPNPATPRFVTCRCHHCNGGIEFDASNFQAGETRPAIAAAANKCLIYLDSSISLSADGVGGEGEISAAVLVLVY